MPSHFLPRRAWFGGAVFAVILAAFLCADLTWLSPDLDAPTALARGGGGGGGGAGGGGGGGGQRPPRPLPAAQRWWVGRAGSSGSPRERPPAAEG